MDPTGLIGMADCAVECGAGEVEHGSCRSEARGACSVSHTSRQTRTYT